MMMDREEFLELIPAYALDALDPEERQAVEARLAQDAEAQRLLAEYRQVSDLLALAVPAREAPAGLGDDLRARLATRRRPALAPAQPAADTAPTQPAIRPARRTVWRIALPLAAGLIVVIGLLAVLLARPAGNGTDLAAIFATLTTENSAQRFTLQPGDVTDQVGGELVAAGDRAVIAVSGLPQIDSEQTFQLWLRGADDVIVSGGLFRPSGNMTYVSVPLEARPLADLAAVGVSLEPAGGSPYTDRPTGPRVFFVPLTPPNSL